MVVKAARHNFLHLLTHFPKDGAEKKSSDQSEKETDGIVFRVSPV
jgi:hypothetical protein